MSSAQGLVLGLLPCYVSYYEHLAADLRHRKESTVSAAEQALARYGTVVRTPMVSDLKSAQAAAAQLEEAGVDAVVVMTTVAVFGEISFAALRDLKLPVILWHVADSPSVPTGYDMSQVVINSGPIGLIALANTLTRHGRPFKVVVGPLQDPGIEAMMETYMKAVAVVRVFRRSKIGLIGQVFPAMTDVELDTEALHAKVGTRSVHIGPDEFLTAYRAVDRERVEAGIADLQASYQADPMDPEDVNRSIRMALALQDLQAHHALDGGAVNCHGVHCMRNPEVGLTGCYGVTRLNGQGTPFACTGDLPTGLALMAMKAICGSQLNSELDFVDLERDAVLLVNEGVGDLALARPETLRVLGNANFTGVEGRRGVSFTFALQPGPATLLSFTPTPGTGQGWRFVVAEGEILDEYVESMGAPNAFFRFKSGEIRTAFARWCEAGAVHHTALAPGHVAEILAAAAEFLGFDFVAV